jgi:hypothetical protein
VQFLVGKSDSDVAARGVAAQTVEVMVGPEGATRFDADGGEDTPTEEKARAGRVDGRGSAESAVVPDGHEREFECKTEKRSCEFMNDSFQNYLLAIFCTALVLCFMFQSLIPLFAITAIFVATALFHLLWNETVPGIFGLRRITFWESFRLLVMAWILFGGVFLRLAVR